MYSLKVEKDLGQWYVLYPWYGVSRNSPALERLLGTFGGATLVYSSIVVGGLVACQYMCAKLFYSDANRKGQDAALSEHIALVALVVFVASRPATSTT